MTTCTIVGCARDATVTRAVTPLQGPDLAVCIALCPWHGFILNEDMPDDAYVCLLCLGPLVVIPAGLDTSRYCCPPCDHTWHEDTMYTLTRQRLQAEHSGLGYRLNTTEARR